MRNIKINAKETKMRLIFLRTIVNSVCNTFTLIICLKLVSILKDIANPERNFKSQLVQVGLVDCWMKTNRKCLPAVTSNLQDESRIRSAKDSAENPPNWGWGSTYNIYKKNHQK